MKVDAYLEILGDTVPDVDGLQVRIVFLEEGPSIEIELVGELLN